MTMGIYQIVFIVVALTYSATSRGYGPASGSASGNIGAGRYTTGASTGGVGGRTSLGGTGSYTGAVSGVRPGAIRQQGGFGGVSGAGSGGIGQPGDFGGVPGYDIAPQPYSISYEAKDEQGGIQFKTESGDGNGNVQGNYGYFDSQGLYRQVEYTADQLGFRANIKTNEPGVGKESPADVNMIVEQTPAGIQEQYTPATAYQTGMPGGLGVGGRAGMVGVPGTSASGGQGFLGGRPVGSSLLQYQGQIGGGASTFVSGSGPQSVSSKQFAGIKKSSSGKSTY